MPLNIGTVLDYQSSFLAFRITKDQSLNKMMNAKFKIYPHLDLRVNVKHLLLSLQRRWKAEIEKKVQD